MNIRRLDASQDDFDAQLSALTRYDASRDSQIGAAVTGILERIQREGDQALLDLTSRLDGFSPASAADLKVDPGQLQQALDALPDADRQALELAAGRIRAYHEHQRADSWSFTEPDGTRLGQKITALDRVGLYVPGGKAAYPSSVLMNAIPARVAGVKDIQMVVPTPGGERNAMVLAAAAVAGVDRVYCVGGAQAVGALAYGTELIDAVDKIVGPGNAYVAEAKRQVFGTVGIDMIAGPSEILVLADGTAPVDWVAMDMFSQAEHDEMAQAILLCPDAEYIEQVSAAIARLLPSMPRAAVIEQSLRDRGALILVSDMQQACDIANRIAPEHLEIMASEPQQWVDQITHAGAVFIGPYSSESLGDYCAGPNHVLPTLRTARFSSPLGVYDFQKRSSLIQVSREGAHRLGPIAAALADREGLAAHAQSARLRLDKTDAQVSTPGASRSVDDVIRYSVSPGVRQMKAYQVAEADNLVKLDSMENPHQLPDDLREKLARRLASLPINRYPVPSYRELKSRLRDVYSIPSGAQVVVGNGSDELILMLSLAVAGSGRPVLAPAPSFALYELSGKLAGAEFVGVDLQADFTLDIDAMLAAIELHQPSLVYIAYPNNPTGGCFDDAQIEQVLHRAPGLVVVDEAYFPFAGRTWMHRIGEFPNLVVMRTVSKIGLAGIRIGYLAADPAITTELEKVRPPYNISVLDEATAVFALEHIDVLDAQAAQIRDGRQAQADALASLAGVEVFDSQTNFLLVRVPDAKKVGEGLIRHGVLVRDVSKMHPALANCLRVTVSTPQENDALLNAMRATLAELA